jgi:hypothetical protein
MISGSGRMLAAAGDHSVPLLVQWRADGFGFLGLSPFSWALLLVILAVVAWACFLREPEDERSRHHRHHWRRRHRKHAAMPTQERPRRWFLFGRRRHRRRRERPLNPTLAETGGLPPPRSEPPSPEI